MPSPVTHAHYSSPCSQADLTAAFGKKRTKTVTALYDDPMTLADLEMEKAIDAGTIPILDGAWGVRHAPVPVAALFGLQLTDSVITNGVARGIITQEQAEAACVTVGRTPAELNEFAKADTLRLHHKARVFVLSERPDLFGLDTLWEINYTVGELNIGVGPEAYDVRPTAETYARQRPAPFTAAQVEALREFQAESETPVRCGQAECVSMDKPRILMPTKDGLRCPSCGTLRGWAWREMLGEEDLPD